MEPTVLLKRVVNVPHLQKTVRRGSLNLTYDDSMGDQTFPARYTTALNMLNTTTTNLYSQYVSAQTTGASLTKQNSELQAQVTNLNAKLATIKKTGDTYDREFLDRSPTNTKRGFFNRNGVNTLQDWLLFMFFVSYVIISLTVLIFTVMASRYKLYAGCMVVIVSIVFGVMMSAVIMRFI